MADQVHDDTQVAIKNIINQQINDSFATTGFSYNEFLHINETNYQASGPNHIVEQGTLSEVIGNETITGKFSYESNGNHTTSHSDYTYNVGGNVFEYKSDYESNAHGNYNLIQSETINGQSAGVFHYHS